MKTIIRQINQEDFNKIQHNKVKNYKHKMTQKDIENLIYEFIIELRKKGVSEEEILNMTFTINYVNHQDEK